MDWMKNRFAADYKRKMANMRESVDHLYKALGICRTVPDAPATRRYSIEKERTIKL
jgi:hypothetical protein